MSNLYLEQRIAIVRAWLNEDTVGFEKALPVKHREAFHQFVIDSMNVLDGFDWCLTDEDRERFKVSKEQQCV